MKLLKSNITLVIICAGVLGYVSMLCLFFFEEIAGMPAIIYEGKQKNFFHENPAYLMWLSVMLLQGALWFILLFPATVIILRIKKELGKEFNLLKTFAILLIALLVLTTAGRFTIFNYLTDPVSSFDHHSIKLQTFTSIARAVGIYFLAGIVLVGRKCIRNMEVRDYDITDYLRLRGYQDMLLNFAGLVLSLGVITSILFNKAVSLQHQADQVAFPPEFVIAFGLLNTLVIVIFYLPNYFIMLDYGKRIVESKFPLETAKKEIIQANFENQKGLSENLRIELTLPESIKKTMLILSPFLSSLLPKFFDLFGK